jgi:hypothetical protein
MHPNPKMAIEAACRLVDEGDDVFGIGTGSLDDSIDRDQIARSYAIWTRGNAPSSGCGFAHGLVQEQTGQARL